MATLAPSAPLRGWLYRPATDLLVMLGPWLITAAVVLLMPGDRGQLTATWLAQIVLGNTTHIILTFVLLGLRPDVLRATKSQAKTVAIGSLIAFSVAWTISWAVERYASRWTGFPLAIMGIFGVHHRLSQAKGVWALYNLRALKLKMPPPSPRERPLQQNWVPIGLLLVAVAWLFVPSRSTSSYPLFQAIPVEPAILPRVVAYGLGALWLAFVLVVIYTVGRSNIPKLVHIVTHGAAVTMAIFMPIWGAIVWGAIHGLEYFFLSARMLERREGDVVKSPPGWLIWPIMLLAMAPIAFLGLGSLPLASSFFKPGAWTADAIRIVNAVTAAHYFADGIIYRFRIPEVRKVALQRLDFSP